MKLIASKLLNRIFNDKRDLSIAIPLHPYQCCSIMIPTCMLVTIDVIHSSTTLIPGGHFEPIKASNRSSIP